MQEAIAIKARYGVGASVRAYHELTKPGITLFVGLTAIAGYAVNARGAIDGVLLVALMLATMCMSGGAAALNQVAEMDTDRMMRRTARRPLPAGTVSPRAATTFAWLLTIIGLSITVAMLPPMTLLMLALCHISYVYFYTPMKRRTEACTLVGAIPGSLPVLAGAAVATSHFSLAVLALTALLFTWQIPHFMSIGWVTREDYGRAGFVMMPVTDQSGRRTARVALLYAIATHGFAILMTREAAAHPAVMALVHTAGTAYIIAVLPFLRTPEKKQARRLFFTSLVVLPVILGAAVLNFALVP